MAKQQGRWGSGAFAVILAFAPTLFNRLSGPQVALVCVICGICLFYTFSGWITKTRTIGVRIGRAIVLLLGCICVASFLAYLYWPPTLSVSPANGEFSASQQPQETQQYEFTLHNESERTAYLAEFDFAISDEKAIPDLGINIPEASRKPLLKAENVKCHCKFTDILGMVCKNLSERPFLILSIQKMEAGESRTVIFLYRGKKDLSIDASTGFSTATPGISGKISATAFGEGRAFQTDTPISNTSGCHQPFTFEIDSPNPVTPSINIRDMGEQ